MTAAATPAAGIRQLDESFDEDYEPTEEEVDEYAAWLGLDKETERDLWWIARMGLTAVLPPPWKPCETAEKEVFYFNFETGESVWDHPCDEYFKAMLAEQRRKKKEGSGGSEEDSDGTLPFLMRTSKSPLGLPPLGFPSAGPKKPMVVESDDPRQTPLHLAAAHDDVHAVALFLDRGSKRGIESRDSSGLRPLHHAARAGHRQAALLLLNGGPEGGAAVDARTPKGWTPLHLAAEHGHAGVVGLLLDRGAEPAAATKRGRTALHLAAEAGSEELVRLLLEKGLGVDVRNEKGKTPLHCAADANSDDVIKILLDQKAALNAQAANGFSALHYAAGGGNTDSLQVLLQAGAEVGPLSKRGETPLQLAAAGGHTRCVEVLLEKHGVGAAGAGAAGKRSALHDAAGCGALAAAKVLLEHKVAVNAADGALSPLHMACFRGHRDVVAALVDANAAVGAVGPHGLTALHVAASAGHREVCEALLEAKAEVTEAEGGMKPLDCALKSEHTTVAELLKA
mmetsp:Transcript_98315/g.225725  ORF Transcript_98315/g.225725 Transcript_98315/m.225725 type:complete len:511 (+) Transcript_98315:30-1562(+)